MAEPSRRTDPPPPVAIAAAAAIVAGLIGTTVAAAWPDIKQWWMRGRSGAAWRRRELTTVDGPAIDRLTREIDAALTGAGSALRLIELLLAASIVTAGEDEPRLRAALERLATPEVVTAVNAGLRADSALLDAETAAIVWRVFDGGWTDQGAFVPLRLERIRTGLRLPLPA